MLLYFGVPAHSFLLPCSSSCVLYLTGAVGFRAMRVAIKIKKQGGGIAVTATILLALLVVTMCMLLFLFASLVHLHPPNS